jgi:hypothetical protein
LSISVELLESGRAKLHSSSGSSEEYLILGMTDKTLALKAEAKCSYANGKRIYRSPMSYVYEIKARQGDRIEVSLLIAWSNERLKNGKAGCSPSTSSDCSGPTC